MSASTPPEPGGHEPDGHAIAALDDASLDAALAGLAHHDLDSVRTARRSRAARAVFEQAHEQATTPPWWSPLQSAYDRAVEPLAVAALCAAYLAWAFEAVIALHT